MAMHRKNKGMGSDWFRQNEICEMTGVREHVENRPVVLCRTESGRLAIRAYNEAGFNCTEVDLVEVLEWAASNKKLLAR